MPENEADNMKYCNNNFSKSYQIDIFWTQKVSQGEFEKKYLISLTIYIT